MKTFGGVLVAQVSTKWKILVVDLFIFAHISGNSAVSCVHHTHMLQKNYTSVAMSLVCPYLCLLSVSSLICVGYVQCRPLYSISIHQSYLFKDSQEYMDYINH